LMAPRVDRTVDRASPARWSSPDRSARIEPEAGGDLVKKHRNHSDIQVRIVCHSSRVKVQPTTAIARSPARRLAAAGV
jgi:hypothetical protein